MMKETEMIWGKIDEQKREKGELKQCMVYRWDNSGRKDKWGMKRDWKMW